MRILHLSNTPLSNAPANLVECLNDAGHEAKLYLHKKSNTNKTFVGGSLWTETPPGILEDEFKRAEVIHFHNYCWDLTIFKERPELLEIAKSKPALIQYHSPRHSTENFEASITDRSLKHAVIAQYHVRQYPECEFVVPNVIPIYNKMYTSFPGKWDDACPSISYAPSNINLKGWDDKGYNVTAPLLKRLERNSRCSADVIINTDYETCLLRKRGAHIGIDEVMTGSYHLSALEYLSMGCVTICHVDDPTCQAMKRIVGIEGMLHMPIIDATPSTLESTLLELLASGKDHLKDIGEKSRNWMERYWNPSKHAQYFENIYRSL
jgi:hypothetical protein